MLGLSMDQRIEVRRLWYFRWVFGLFDPSLDDQIPGAAALMPESTMERYPAFGEFVRHALDVLAGDHTQEGALPEDGIGSIDISWQG